MLTGVAESKCYETRMTCNYTIRDLAPSETYVIYITVRRTGDMSDGPPSPVVHVKTKCAGINIT